MLKFTQRFPAQVVFRKHNFLAPVAGMVALSLMLGACSQTNILAPGLNPSQLLHSGNTKISTSDLPSVADAQVAKNDTSDEKALTKSLRSVVNKARQKRLAGKPGEALKLLDDIAKKPKNSKNKVLAKERGFLALELGQLVKAEKLIKTAINDAQPDWRLHSALGSTYAAKGDQAAAQRQFALALELAPNHPSILNNLALSFALEGRHTDAEQLLRKAVRSKDAQLQSKQNLALLLGLEGNLGEARRISRAALPENQSELNIGFLERLKQRTPKKSRADKAAKNYEDLRTASRE